MKKNLWVDALIVVASIFFAWTLSFVDIGSALLALPPEYEWLAIFAAGLAFVSVFTIAPSMVVLGQLAIHNSFFLVVVLGAFGALLMDLLIFTFFRNRIAQDVGALCQVPPGSRVPLLCRLHLSRWVLAVLGGLIIASPLPDELGLAMMGVGRVSFRMLIPISLSMNALGIMIVGLVARAL